MKISVSCKLLLYADDRILIVLHKDVDVIVNRLGKELELCKTWMINNKLSLHLWKTEDCTPTAQLGIRTQARRFVVRDANYCTAEAHATK